MGGGWSFRSLYADARPIHHHGRRVPLVERKMQLRCEHLDEKSGKLQLVKLVLFMQTYFSFSKKYALLIVSFSIKF